MSSPPACRERAKPHAIRPGGWVLRRLLGPEPVRPSKNDSRKPACHRYRTSRPLAKGTWQREAPEAHAAFRDADGDIEFTTDGTCVNTWEGWREMRVGIYSKRSAGEPATPDECGTRKLPTTNVRLAFAAIEKSNRFGRRWHRWAQRLGTGARWRVRRVNRMAGLCSLLYSDHWDAYWAAN